MLAILYDVHGNRPALEAVLEDAQGAGADRFLLGGLVNPGSVGEPWDGDVRAAYALLDDDNTLTLRRVAYDVEAAATAVEQIGDPRATITALRLRTARF